MPSGLAVSDVVNVQILLSPNAAPGREFGTMLIIGSSPVIDTLERIRLYSQLGQVASDFGTSAPEYLAATAFFSQSPQPNRLKIGRWAQSATNGLLRGAVLLGTAQSAAFATVGALTTGTLSVTIDGTPRSLTGLNFSAALNLNGIASVINTALGVNGTCTFDGTRFRIVSATAGTSSTVAPATSSGTDVAGLLGLSAAAGAVAVPGIAAESAVAGLQALANAPGDWYAASFAPLTPLSDNNAALVAAVAEGLAPSRLVGFTTSNTAALDPASTTDLAAALNAAGYARSTVQFSSTHAYAIASFFGRTLTVDWNGFRTALTLKFKQEPGVVPETLTEAQAAALAAKNANVFITYQNGSAILQEGTVANGRFFDEVFGLDWLANTVQTDLWNLLYTTPTKIPQTDEGVHTLLTQVEATLGRGLTNGLLAAGTWNQEGFGQLKRGDPLPKGFYVYAPLVATQSQADREARKAPLLQVAVKLAGAIHHVDVQLTINR